MGISDFRGTLIQHERQPLQDHCGIVAAFSPQDIPFFQTGLRGLQLLQTRGYDGAGFWASDTHGTTYQYKGVGMVNEVFSPEILQLYREIRARIWMYQVRYGTQGNFQKENVQPVVGYHKQTGEVCVVVHNGQFSREAGEGTEGESDTVRFTRQLTETKEKSWEERIHSCLSQKKGAWSLIIGTTEGLYLARDSYGFRPLVYGHVWKEELKGYIWVAASETSSLETMGAIDCFELVPGTFAKITTKGLEIISKNPETKRALCIFENVYIQHGAGKAFVPRNNPRKIISSPNVDDVRRRTGAILAREAPLTKHDVDMVIGIPGTGIEGGMQFARALDIPYFQAITDRASSFMEQRTFMTSKIEKIYQKVLEHFSFDEQTLKGRRVALVDDSIVRGNITKGLVSLLKDLYSVSVVHLRIVSPPIDKTCHLGLNTRSQEELIAYRHGGNIHAIQNELGADSLAYLSSRGLREAITGDPNARGFCMGCMAGQQYPIDIYGNEIKKNGLKKSIQTSKKQPREEKIENNLPGVMIPNQKHS